MYMKIGESYSGMKLFFVAQFVSTRGKILVNMYDDNYRYQTLSPRPRLQFISTDNFLLFSVYFKVLCKTYFMAFNLILAFILLGVNVIDINKILEREKTFLWG
jgi:hypothetical protein